MAVLLKVENLKAAYGGIHALRGVSLQVEEGEIVSVLGANGAGKSTLLKCISAVMKRVEGNIEFDGKPISNKPYEIVEAGLVQVPEARQIFAKLTVEENLRVGAGNRKDIDGIKKDFERVYALFPRLKERERQYGGLLSGGEQQMLAIARGIMAKPKLMMFDEPSLGLAREQGAPDLRPRLHHADRPCGALRHRQGAAGGRYPQRRLPRVISNRIPFMQEPQDLRLLRFPAHERLSVFY